MSHTTGERLKELRKEWHLTQEKVAQHLNITREAYSLYENDKRQMNHETICRLSDFYGISADYLLMRQEAKQTYTLNPDESQLLDAFRKSDQRGQKLLLEISKIVDP